MAKATLYFPTDFLWGTGTAAHQVEGQNSQNDWWLWEQAGHILHQHTSGLACNWWDLTVAKADLAQAAELGNNAHRLSVEWSRIEPEPSVFDEEALAQYRELLAYMHTIGIEPLVTLHHFTNPQWLVAKGDFHSAVVVDYFQRFVHKVVATLGDLIPKWVTINEPLVYFVLRYLDQVFPQPQGRSGWSAGLVALRNLLRCHAAAYHTIKAVYPQALVGVAKQYRPLDPLRAGHLLDQLWAKRLSWAFNEAWMEALATGKLRQPLGRGRIDGLAGTFDFVGINYYTRDRAKLLRLPQPEWPSDSIVSEGNYGEVYPYGLYRAIEAALRFDKPIYITENGLPDRDDALRPAFLIAHLHQVWHALNVNYPVMGYYHWSLIDNFEWDRGWTQRFGLIEMNPETQARRWRNSGRLYGEICHTNSLSSEMVERYTTQLLPKIFPSQGLHL